MRTVEAFKDKYDIFTSKDGAHLVSANKLEGAFFRQFSNILGITTMFPTLGKRDKVQIVSRTSPIFRRVIAGRKNY